MRRAIIQRELGLQGSAIMRSGPQCAFGTHLAEDPELQASLQ
jgi:hypothetical protein